VEAVREVVVIDPVDLQAIRRTAEEVGAELAEVPPFRGIEPVTAALLLVGAPGAVEAVQLEIERRKGGLVFDLRAGAVRPIHRSKAVAYGEATVFALDGVVRIPEYSGQQAAALTRLASGRGAKTVALVHDAIDGKRLVKQSG
jgi:hypothetical protein